MSEEIKGTMDSISEKVKEFEAYVYAYNYSIKSFRSVIEGYFKESKILEEELEKGYTGVNLGKLLELNAKTKLMREVICFMEKTLSEAKNGEGKSE